MDATRVTDGRVVAIKRILTPLHKFEIPICEMLNTPERRNNPRNHAVELLDRFTNEKYKNEEFIVMPVLVPFDFPPFVSIDEVADFINQVLEVWRNVAFNAYNSTKACTN
jgi:AAA+ ATPase superfamily predicted ATPase